ncbi:MAG: inositol monophosphatase family protein [Nitrospirales bacterium]|nr:inositol monophosphatase family protein [Nitrospirales bacterium]
MALSQNEIHSLTNTAIKAARAGGAVLNQYAQQTFHIQKKDYDVNLLTEADLKSEEVVIKTLNHAYPSHQILSEEKGLHPSSDQRFKWIIDPLDGTTNFAHGFPMYNVSIGLEYEGTRLIGVVYDPTRNELFVGQKDHGATLNGSSIHVSATAQLDKALLVTGFAYDVHTVPDNNLKEFCHFTLRARGLRRTGSAAIDLCYVACGRFDGFWERSLHPWDTAAGTLIVEEAGGKVTHYKGEPFSIYGKEIVASNGIIHQEMVSALHEIRS